MRVLLARALTGHDRWIEELQRRDDEAQRQRAQWDRRLAVAVQPRPAQKARAAHQEAGAFETEIRHRPERAEFNRRAVEWAPARAVIERECGPLPSVVDMTPPLHELSVTTAAPAEWRWNVLDALTTHAGFMVDPTGLASYVPLQPDVQKAAAVALVRTFLCAARRAGWVWFWGSRGPRPGEAITILCPLGRRPDQPEGRALRPAGSGLVTGPTPGRRGDAAGHDVLLVAVARSRMVGVGAYDVAFDQACVEAYNRAMGSGPGEIPMVDDPLGVPVRRTPSRSGYAALLALFPQFRRWVVLQDWPVWADLPAELHNMAKMTAYVACCVRGHGSVEDLRLGDSTRAETTRIIDALDRSKFIAIDPHSPKLWHATYGERSTLPQPIR